MAIKKHVTMIHEVHTQNVFLSDNDGVECSGTHGHVNDKGDGARVEDVYSMETRLNKLN